MTQLSNQIRELAEQYEPNGCALTDAQWINLRNKAARVLLKNAPTILAALELYERWEAPGCVEALNGITDDYMTSDVHHPGYVLIPTAKFEQLAAISAMKGERE